MEYRVIIFFVLLMINTTSIYSQEMDSLKGNAAFIFAYYPKESLKTDFERGYKQHLNWHKKKYDQLVWYAWYVQTGSRLGLFIDGTFGLSFKAFDNRVDQAGDRDDFAKTTAPYTNLVYRKVYYLKENMSTSSLLENRTPSANIEVFEIVVQSGTEKKFENVFIKLTNKLERRTNKPKYSLYRLVTGGEHTGYLLMIPRNNFSYFENDSSFDSIQYIIEKYLPEESSFLMEDLSKSVKKQTSETWSYRKDLSYFPQKTKIHNVFKKLK